MKVIRVLPSPICVVTGLYYLTFGALLFFWPNFFFTRLAPIGVFNEHYARDIGSFLLPLGIALLFAARDSRCHGGVIGLAAAASILHAVSHLEDGVHSYRDLASDISLTAVAVLLLIAFPYGRKEKP